MVQLEPALSGGIIGGIFKPPPKYTAMSLTDTAIKAAEPGDKPFKLTDSAGMYVFVHPNGSKYFRLDYRINGARRTLALGVYPSVSLKKAREKRDEARVQIAAGLDPSATRKQSKNEAKAAIQRQKRIEKGEALENSFKDIALNWLKSIDATNGEPTRTKKLSRFERYIFPIIGDVNIREITANTIYQLIKPLIDQGKIETTQRVRAEIAAVFNYAIVHNLADFNPAQPVLKQIPPKKVKSFAAITDPKEVGRLLRDLYSYQGTYVVECAVRFSPLVFQRPGEIRQMLWSDVDLEAREWRPHVTKTDFIHFVPLSTQAIEILKALQPLTGRGKYVFPSSRGDGRPMSDGTVRTALKALGYSSDIQTAHGFRSIASTLLNEQGWRPDAIERQLGHMPKDKIRAVYNRAEYLAERKKMMQAWADYLDSLRTGAVITPIRSATS